MGRVVGGLIAIALGIGVIVVSYQFAQPGGIYFVPVGLIASGFLMIFRGLATPSATNRKRRIYARPARSTMNSHAALPKQVRRGYCWQCGRKVREGNAICYSCGAAQIHVAAPHTSADSAGASQAGWDPAGSVPTATAVPWTSPSPPAAAPGQAWSGPVFQPDPASQSMHVPPGQSGVSTQLWHGPTEQPGGIQSSWTAPPWQ